MAPFAKGSAGGWAMWLVCPGPSTASTRRSLWTSYHLGKTPWVQVGAPPDGTSLEEKHSEGPTLGTPVHRAPSQVLPSHCAWDMHRHETPGATFGLLLYVFPCNSQFPPME